MFYQIIPDSLPREMKNNEVIPMIFQLTVLGEFPGHGTRKGNAAESGGLSD